MLRWRRGARRAWGCARSACAFVWGKGLTHRRNRGISLSCCFLSHFDLLILWLLDVVWWWGGFAGEGSISPVIVVVIIVVGVEGSSVDSFSRCILDICIER
ncbi:uncharacterized protein BDV14DRAFT_180819, partial [Aspergillus stella-maris]|uniref:uncharacterized protein n=1 Tax=Aspergillus stella-maris TaxID=1810926 RepID=UPI003CCDC658